MTVDPSKSPRLNNPNSANYSSPSVPISVYKQLAGELNVAKSEMAALKSENQQLRSNNQKLQQQVHQVIQATEHLKQMVNRYDFGMEGYQQLTPPEPQAPLVRSETPLFELAPQPPAPEPQPQYSPQQPSTPQNGAQKPPVNPASPQKSQRKPKPKTIENLQPPNFASSEEVEGGVNGWVILFAAIAIVLTAFGAGYMVVLPLLNNNNSNSQ